MKARYCDTRFHTENVACNIGWGDADSRGVRSCYDEPALENCRNLVDPSNLHCPSCGSWIENPFDDVSGIPLFDHRVFGSDIEASRKWYKENQDEH